MSAYALYRLPHADQYTQIEGETCECLSCTQLNGQSGFVVAPFEVKEEQPIVLIRPDKVTSHPSPLTSHPSHLTSHLSPLTSSYSIDFANYHSQLLQGTFRKIVLARQADETTLQPIDPVELFHCACQLYPRMFIALVYTPQSGTWLTATPEILLEGSGCDWRTIALAGTMRLEDGQLDGEGENTTWSTKNIEEQRVVATYIAQCLEQFANDFREEGPRTVRAANLVHSPRRYYSGFMGPLQTPSTHLYVSLRCMNIEGNIYHLYAGGGLLRDSTLEQEWQETEAKLETMRRCLVTKRM